MHHEIVHAMHCLRIDLNKSYPRHQNYVFETAYTVSLRFGTLRSSIFGAWSLHSELCFKSFNVPAKAKNMCDRCPGLTLAWLEVHVAHKN